jgi:hypothetical protein
VSSNGGDVDQHPPSLDQKRCKCLGDRERTPDICFKGLLGSLKIIVEQRHQMKARCIVDQDREGSTGDRRHSLYRGTDLAGFDDIQLQQGDVGEMLESGHFLWASGGCEDVVPSCLEHQRKARADAAVTTARDENRARWTHD